MWLFWLPTKLVESVMVTWEHGVAEPLVLCDGVGYRTWRGMRWFTLTQADAKADSLVGWCVL